MFSFKFHASQRGQSAGVFRVAIKDPVEVARSRIQILRINIQESEPEVIFGLRRSDRDGFLKLNPRFRRTLQSGESHSECAITRRISRPQFGVSCELHSSILEFRQPHKGTPEAIKRHGVFVPELQGLLESLDCVSRQRHFQSYHAESELHVRVVRCKLPSVDQQGQGFFEVSRVCSDPSRVPPDIHQSSRSVRTRGSMRNPSRKCGTASAWRPVCTYKRPKCTCALAKSGFRRIACWKTSSASGSRCC